MPIENALSKDLSKFRTYHISTTNSGIFQVSLPGQRLPSQKL